MKIPPALALAAGSVLALGVTQSFSSMGYEPPFQLEGAHLQSMTSPFLLASGGRAGVLSARDPQAWINIRTSPSTQSSVIVTGTVNTPVVILSESQGADGFTWYQVRLNDSAEGWVRGDLVRITGDAVQAPIAQQPSPLPPSGLPSQPPQGLPSDRPLYDPSSGALLQPTSSSTPALSNPSAPAALPAPVNPPTAALPPASSPSAQEAMPRYQRPVRREIVVDQQGQRDLSPTSPPAQAVPAPVPEAAQPTLVDRVLQAPGAILNAVGNILQPGPAPLNVTQEAIDYFLDVAMGSEWGGSGQTVRKWNRDLRIRVTGDRTAEDDRTIAQVIQDLNELLRGSGVQLVRDDRNPNVEIFYAPESQFRQLERNYVPGNLGFFWTYWDGDTINSARILITNTNRVTQRQRSHLLREELTQVLGLMRDSNRYPSSIFYQGWTDVTDYADIDRTIIRMLYHPQVRPGMTRPQVVATLRSLSDPAQAARMR